MIYERIWSLKIPEEFEERDDRSYETLKEEGVFELKLKFRGWYRKAFSLGLICYFETADGEKYKLFCFRRTKNGEDQYRPKHCKGDFEKVDDDTWCRCTLEKNKKDNLISGNWRICGGIAKCM